MGFAAAREALFTGEIVNPSEGRAATHVAERGSGVARGRRPGDCAAPADARAGRRDRGGRVRRRHRRPAHRHRRLGARTRRCWSTRLGGAVARSTSASCRISTARRSTRRCKHARPGDDAGGRRVQDLHHQETLANLEAARAWLRGARGRRSRRPSSSRSPPSPKPRSRRASTRPASCRSAKASAGAIRCGARSG